MSFTHEEFNIMVYELTECNPSRFNMLCEIARKTLFGMVAKWCREDIDLRGLGLEEDLMHDICVHLMKVTVPRFLLKNGASGPKNCDPEGFKSWLFTVAQNKKRDLAAKVRSYYYRNSPIIDDDPRLVSEERTNKRTEIISDLCRSFTIALSLNCGIYKLLTWIAQFVLILDRDITKIKSNDIIVKFFSDKTLFEMYAVLKAKVNRLGWLSITEEQNARILKKLQKPMKNGVCYGDTVYKEFFMLHNGVPSGKKSISDWVNRINSAIKRQKQ